MYIFSVILKCLVFILRQTDEVCLWIRYFAFEYLNCFSWCSYAKLVWEFDIRFGIVFICRKLVKWSNESPEWWEQKKSSLATIRDLFISWQTNLNFLFVENIRDTKQRKENKISDQHFFGRNLFEDGTIDIFPLFLALLLSFSTSLQQNRKTVLLCFSWCENANKPLMFQVFKYSLTMQMSISFKYIRISVSPTYGQRKKNFVLSK